MELVSVSMMRELESESMELYRGKIFYAFTFSEGLPNWKGNCLENSRVYRPLEFKSLTLRQYK